MDREEREIIETEIERMQKAWEDAQERYGITGSRSSERTMTKYRVLINALEKSLKD